MKKRTVAIWANTESVLRLPGKFLRNPNALSVLERVVDGEERWQTLGLLGGRVVVLVAHTVFEADGEEFIRIISARKATSNERAIYEGSRRETN